MSEKLGEEHREKDQDDKVEDAEGKGGKHLFGFTYDDTGATAEVDAPNGWTMQRVIDEAYEELEETAKPDDRVEFTGSVGVVVMTAELRALKVKDFIDRKVSTDNRFHIVSKPGGAIR